MSIKNFKIFVSPLLKEKSFFLDLFHLRNKQLHKLQRNPYIKVAGTVSDCLYQSIQLTTEPIWFSFIVQCSFSQVLGRFLNIFGQCTTTHPREIVSPKKKSPPPLGSAPRGHQEAQPIVKDKNYKIICNIWKRPTSTYQIAFFKRTRC